MKTVTLEQVKQAGVLLKKEHEERLRLEKEAAGLQLEKRAAKIAFREVELGLAEPFRSYDEFLQKVASLAKDDLDVIEKALDRGYNTASRFGSLDDAQASQDGRNVFERFVLTGEF